MRVRTLGVCLGLIVLMALPTAAQQTKKPSEIDFLPIEEPKERPARAWDPYALSVTMEVGGQIVDVSGNQDVYRAHQNYRDGFRVFAFDIRGKGTKGALFTDFYVEGAGWGNEPYSWARFGFSRNNWFDFRGSYRESEYFWAFPGFALDQHRNDTTRRLQDYNLTFFPQRKFRVKLGYTRNSSFGMALTSLSALGDQFPLIEPIRQTYDEYRLGAEWQVARWNFFTEYGYRFVRNDRKITSFADFDPGNRGPSVGSSLEELERLYPIRGKVPSFRFTLAGRPHKTLDVTARLLYSDIKMNATRDEFIASRNVTNQQIETTIGSLAEGGRPQTVADGALTWRPVPEFTLSNTFRFNQFHITGDLASETETANLTTGTTTLSDVLFQGHLKYKNTFNRLEGRYDFNRYVGVRAGYIYTHRDVESLRIEDLLPEPLESTELDTHTLLLGGDVRINRTFRLFADWEHGKADNVFTRVSAADVDRFRVRSQWEPTRGVRFNTSWFIFDNTNPNPLIESDQENRGYALDFQFFRFERGYVNLGYARNDINSHTDIVFFVGGVLTQGVSVYVANDNYAYLDFGGRLVRQLYFDAGYRVVFDSGTFPASNPSGGCVPLQVGPCVLLTGLDPLGVNRGGLNYHQPHAALRYSFSDNVSWKAGWRWYGYNQKTGTISDYKAHIVTTSLVLTL